MSWKRIYNSLSRFLLTRVVEAQFWLANIETDINTITTITMSLVIFFLLLFSIMLFNPNVVVDDGHSDKHPTSIPHVVVTSIVTNGSTLIFTICWWLWRWWEQPMVVHMAMPMACSYKSFEDKQYHAWNLLFFSSLILTYV